MKSSLGRARRWVGPGLIAVLLGACAHTEKAAEEVDEQLSEVEAVFREDEAEATGAAKRDGGGEGATRPSRQRPKSFSREWYVSTSGSDQAAGSKQAPFRTIGRALKAVGPGEAIRVLPGEYKGSVVIDGGVKAGRADAPITLLGTQHPKIVPGASGAVVQIRKPFWVVDGFDIDVKGQPRFAVVFEGNTEGSVLAGSRIHHGALGGGVTTYGGARKVTIEGNDIHHFRKKPKGDSHGVVVQATSRDITIRDNDIHDNSGDSVQCLKPDSASVTPARGVVVEGNRLYSNDENAVDIKTCSDVVVRDNDMHGFKKSPSSAGEAVVVHYSAKNVRVEGNRISDAGRGISIGGVRDGGQPSPSDVEVKGNRIKDISNSGGSDGVGIRVENARGVRVLGNSIEGTDGYGMMLGLGANNAPSENLTVRENEVRGRNLVRIGQRRPGLRMDQNRYGAGGRFKADPKETNDFAEWKRLSGVDERSDVLP
ncbi:right-handed parallel beta-helix repeat-containing protein [Pyxidicoccus xibeiensis]|uniref:right-handed parallel beta-helix repeat-containing protein n=1 Tax=Pyxidicoccus xibeiensis TaxID=2906759 RepID=UPI0020A81D2D|nr:right-handed parallel beta-helix repeat-containing protein [Pyxidicoccus xibeiensis]MCP3144528.1 right-handed parallel beta-helix repeat-containing protein [Pyxidicoccus xibeiensis]